MPFNSLCEEIHCSQRFSPVKMPDIPDGNSSASLGYEVTFAHRTQMFYTANKYSTILFWIGEQKPGIQCHPQSGNNY